MNYIALLNQFWRLRREVPFSSAEADLYFYLLDISNGLNWKNPFQQSNALICATIGVSEKPLITARNRLKQHGLIDFTPGVKRSPSTYKLLLLENLQPIREECDSKSGSISGSECDSLSGENPPDINKHKLKEEKAASADSSSSSLKAEAKPEIAALPASPAKPPRSPKKPTASADEVAALPLPHPGPGFAQLWADFRAMPKQVKKPVTSLRRLLATLSKYEEGFAQIMVEKAIEGNWSGVEFDGTAEAYAKWQAEQARRPSPPPAPASFNPDELFGYSQSAADGLAQARQSPEYQQYLAEQAQANAAQLQPTDTHAHAA
jgi:hypothetical protein